MKTSITTKRRPKFLGTVEDLPESGAFGGPRGAAPYWVEVATAVKAEPGVWHKVAFDHLTRQGHSSAVQRINAASRDADSKTSKNPAFTEPGYTAAYRDGAMYVRYDAPKVASIKSRRAG